MVLSDLHPSYRSFSSTHTVHTYIMSTHQLSNAVARHHAATTTMIPFKNLMKLLNCFKCPFLSNFLLIFSTFALSASTFAAPTLEKDWIVPIHGWIYNPERRSKRRRAVLSLLTNVVDDVLDLDESEINKDILYKRVNPFIVDNHRRRKITLRFNDEIQRELPKRSRKNGHFTASLKFTPEELEHIRNSENTISYQAVTGIKNDNRVFQGTTQVLEPTGFSVISDVDDTIKLSYVLDKKKLVRHTFLQDFVAVPDMSNLYQRWYKERHASFHYVSSSPWQLYSELALFLQSVSTANICARWGYRRTRSRCLWRNLSTISESSGARVSSGCH